MDKIWSSTSLARKIMTITLVLLFVSQFFEYVDSSDFGHLSIDSDFNSELTIWFGDAYGTGWQLHPQAYVIIAGLALVFLNEFSETAFWSRWGWWISVVLIWAAAVPLAARTVGGKMGLLCMALAIVAAFVHRRERKAELALAGKPPHPTSP